MKPIALVVEDDPSLQREMVKHPPAACGCPIGGTPTCVAGTCKLCTDPGSPGCAVPPPPPLDAGGPKDASLPGSVHCDYKVSGYEYCYSYEGLTASETSAVEKACLAESGASVVSTCPTTGVSACCEDITTTGASYTYGYCVYGVPSSAIAALKTACTTDKGTFSL